MTTGPSLRTKVVVREADPEFERLLAEEEEIERRQRAFLDYEKAIRVRMEIQDEMEVIRHFERYRSMLQRKYNA